MRDDDRSTRVFDLASTVRAILLLPPRRGKSEMGVPELFGSRRITPSFILAPQKGAKRIKEIFGLRSFSIVTKQVGVTIGGKYG